MKNSKKNFFNKKYFNSKNFFIFKNDFKYVLNYLNKGKKKLINKKIIDIGCGNGSFLYFLKMKYKNNEFYGLDNDKNLISKNKKNKFLKDVKFYNSSCENKISNKKFDLITMLGTINLFDNQKKIFGNLLKNLKKNGLLIVNLYLNKNDIDMSLYYKKYYNKNTHFKNSIFIKSMQRTRKYFLKKVSKLVIMENNIPFKIRKNRNSMNIYTSLINGKNVRTNDLNLIYDQYLIVAKK